MLTYNDNYCLFNLFLSFFYNMFNSLFELNKNKKLFLLAIVVFFVVLFLVLFSGGFFDRALPVRFVGDDCSFISDFSLRQEKIFVSGFSLQPVTEIIISENEGVYFSLANSDNENHQILLLCRDVAEDDYRILFRELVLPGKNVSMTGLINPGSENSDFSGGISIGDLSLRSLPDISQCMLSCITCSGEKSQIKVFLE